jgi:hypothetical protein
MDNSARSRGRTVATADELVKLGTATLVGGYPLDVYAGPDKTVTLYEPESTVSFTLSDGGVEELRELLGRAAMPGRLPVNHGPACRCTPCMAEPSYESRRAEAFRGAIPGGE